MHQQCGEALIAEHPGVVLIPAHGNFSSGYHVDHSEPVSVQLKEVVSVSELSEGNEGSSRDCFLTPLPNGILWYFRLLVLWIFESADVVSTERGM